MSLSPGTSKSRRLALDTGWQMRGTGDWMPVGGLSTVGAALRAAGVSSSDDSRRLDSEEYWLRTSFPAAPVAANERVVLGLDGLATLTDVRLNGAPVVTSDNMFHAHEIDVADLLRHQNELVVRCRPLTPELQVRRSRPRWRAPMVEHQQLRWFRTTLLGRTPGWSPSVPAVGPWRGVWIERRDVEVTDVRVRTELREGWGFLHLSCAISVPGTASTAEVSATLERQGSRLAALLHKTSEEDGYAGTIEVRDAARWWPHTHGEPALYRLRLSVTARERSSAPIDVDLGAIGFRTLTLDRADGDFALRVNDVPVFCRGACWTPLDPIGFRSSPAEYREAIEQVRSAGMNMLRVPGTTVYETQTFFDLCDEAGVLVWQDFMFANMDYPAADEQFMTSVRTEAQQQLQSWQRHPSVAVICGNSEVSQQAAMWGAPRELWNPPLFAETLASLAHSICPDVPYCPSSACGGAFPHQPDTGPTSYYGVGAYLRPLADARRSNVRFASECLAFANVPEQATIDAMPGGPGLRVHHPAWKARTPRDLGAGWDFEDVRDHYLQSLFRVDAARLRATDHDRYLALGRVVTGEVMSAALSEWRRHRSTCRGALILSLRDLVCGAGWGLVGADGIPKAAYYYVRRASRPCAVVLTDEGCNGLYLHAINDTPHRIDARIDVKLFNAAYTCTGSGTQQIMLAPHSSSEWPAGALLSDFRDLTYAFRFGPPDITLVVATLTAAGGQTVDAFYFPCGLPSSCEATIGLTATTRLIDDDRAIVTLASEHLAQSVVLDVDGYQAEDQYFHIAPSGKRDVVLTRRPSAAPVVPSGTARALNCATAARIAVEVAA